MDESTSKKCSKCETVKPLDDYYVRKGKHQARCKKCVMAASRAWAIANPERAAEHSTQWQRRNKDRVRAHNVEWYSANKERELERAAKWKRDNAERHKVNMIAWRARPENAERLRAISAQYRAENLEQIKARLRANPQKGRLDANRRRARKLAATIGPIDLDLLWVRQCAVCPLCSERIDPAPQWPDPMSKSVDHVVPLSKGGTHEQSNLQWTHLVCNIRKGAKAP